MANHDYTVVVVDMYGVAYGELPTAVPTRVTWELDAIGECQIDVYYNDPQVVDLLPFESLPGGREIQLWRDQELIWWGLPVSVTWDATVLHLTCSGLLWYFSTRYVGPITFNALLNAGFEGLSGGVIADWAAYGTTLTTESSSSGGTVLVGSQAARLTQAGTPTSDTSFLYQTVYVSTGADGAAYTVSAWCFLDPTHAFAPAYFNYGISLLLYDSTRTNLLGRADEPIQASEPIGQWNNHTVTILVPANVTDYQIDVRLYSPTGSIIWDDCSMQLPQSVGSPVAGEDVFDIIDALVTYAQDRSWAKSPLNMAVAGSPIGITAERIYQFYDNTAILDALNEFPAAGWCDFDVVYGAAAGDSSGHTRKFQVFAPSKGAIQMNYPLDGAAAAITTMAGGVDGSQVATAQRMLGQGGSGAAADMAFDAYPAFVGFGQAPGRDVVWPTVVTDVSETSLSQTITTATPSFYPYMVNEAIYSLAGNLPIGAIVSSVSADNLSLTFTVPQNPNPPTSGQQAAFFTMTGDTVVIGGVIVEASGSSIPNQPVGTIYNYNKGNLRKSQAPQALPTCRVRADAEPQIFGNVTVGDIIPVELSYGWAGLHVANLPSGNLMRVMKLSLYPQTEELEVGVAVISTPTV